MKLQRVGERIAERMRALGFWNERTGHPAVARFCLEKGYMPSYVYRWLKGDCPHGPALVKLARDLETSTDWLLTGEEPGKAESRRGQRIGSLLLLALGLGAASALGWPSGGVPVQPGTPPVTDAPADARHYVNLRRRRWSPLLLPA